MPDVVEPGLPNRGRSAEPRRPRAVRRHGNGEHQQIRDRGRPHRAAGEVSRSTPIAIALAVRRSSRGAARRFGRRIRRSCAMPGAAKLRVDSLIVGRSWQDRTRCAAPAPTSNSTPRTICTRYLDGPQPEDRRAARLPGRAASTSTSNTIAARSTDAPRSRDRSSIRRAARSKARPLPPTKSRPAQTRITRTPMPTGSSASPDSLPAITKSAFRHGFGISLREAHPQGARSRRALRHLEGRAGTSRPSRRSDRCGDARQSMPAAGVAAAWRRRGRRHAGGVLAALWAASRRACHAAPVSWPWQRADGRDGRSRGQWRRRRSQANSQPCNTAPSATVPAAAHVRSYFPEALYINPEIITDRQRRRQHLHPHGRFHHHLAHGHDGLHHARRARQRHVQPQSLPGFLRRSRPARHAHPGRPRLHPRRRLQLLRRARRRQPATAARRLVLAGRGHRRQDRRRRIRPRRRIAVHARSQAHRQIQADALGPHERRCATAPTSWSAKSKSSPTAASRAMVFNGRLETTVAHDARLPRRRPSPTPARSSSGSIPAR